MLTRLGVLREQIEQDDAARRRAADLSAQIEASTATRSLWDEVNEAIGSASGDKFRRFAQSVTLEQLVALANRRLALLAPRYRLERAGRRRRRSACRSSTAISATSAARRVRCRAASAFSRRWRWRSLWRARGARQLRRHTVHRRRLRRARSATLDVAIDALETLQGQGRKVGVISHVESVAERIATQDLRRAPRRRRSASCGCARPVSRTRRIFARWPTVRCRGSWRAASRR